MSALVMQALYAKKMFFIKDFRFNHAFVVIFKMFLETKIACLTTMLLQSHCLLHYMLDSK